MTTLLEASAEMAAPTSLHDAPADWQGCGAAYVAVYGTLRAGGINDIARLQPGIACVGRTQLTGTLHDLGWYPGLSLQGTQAVLAEVYPMDHALEQAMDRIEGLWPMEFISEPVLTLTGWSADAFVQGQQHFGQIIDPHDSERIAPLVQAALHNDQPYHVEYRITTRDGQRRWVAEYGRGAADDHGVMRWIDGVLLDVTEAKERNAQFVSTVQALDRAEAVAEFHPPGAGAARQRQLFAPVWLHPGRIARALTRPVVRPCSH